MARPKLLVVSPRFLFPLDEGGKIRTSNILRHMKGGNFELLLASPAPPDVKRFDGEIASICDVFLSWEQNKVSQVRRISALASELPISVAGDRSPSGRGVISRALECGTDLLLADFPHAAVLLPQRLCCPSVIFTHNVEAEILERHAAVANGLWRSIWISQARKMRRFESVALRRFDCAIAVSARDAQLLREEYQLSVVQTIDTGIDLHFYSFSSPRSTPDPPATGGTIVFVGAMNSPANIDAVQFLLDQVWPRVLATRPQARLVIVGRNPPASLVARARQLSASCELTGYVEDTRPYIRQSHIAVIPMRVGSGTRIKAFEAMALGRPVVSTTVGVEGLDIEAGAHYLAADRADDFADAMLRLLGDAGLRERLAAAARARLEERFSWRQVARRFEEICLEAQRAGVRARTTEAVH